MTGAVQAMFAGGGNIAPPAVSIAPNRTVTNSQVSFGNNSNFTATFTGGTPSSIVWSVESVVNATASIVAGQGTNTATVQLITNDSGGGVAVGTCTVRCTAIIGGVAYSATARKEHDFLYTNQGGGGA